MKKGKGFVLLETIVVISILCITLVILYTGYTDVTRSIKNNLNFDNTEYLYKTVILKSYLENDIDESWIKGNNYYVYPFFYDNNIYEKNANNNYSSVYLESNLEDDDKSKYMDLFKKLHVKAVYITTWDIKKEITDNTVRGQLNPTVISYVHTLNEKSKKDGFRLIVMYDNENNLNSGSLEVASIEFRTNVYNY